VKKTYLLAPGPTPVPPEVLLRMAQPVIHHRTPQFDAALVEVTEGLKRVFRTANDVLILTSSGSGAMEAAVVNTVRAAEKALVVRGGKFGERWGDICQAFGIPFTAIDVEWGRAVDPEVIRKHLQADPSIGIVCTTLCETSTAVVTDIAAIGRIVRETKAVLAVDGISAVGAIPMETDAWGVDLLAVGSQKALMLPPGLAFIAVSPKAWAKIDAAPTRCFYFNLKEARTAFAQKTTPWTPALTLVLGLQESLKMIEAEGLENIWARTKVHAKAARAAAEALGLSLYAKDPSDCVTAIIFPPNVKGEAVVKKMRDEYGVTVAGGQEQLKGKICRISHMGYVEEMDLLVAISALEMALTEAGVPLRLGAGVAAAQKVFLDAKARK
jgi:aspartate aminotransferase-like enzyme